MMSKSNVQLKENEAKFKELILYVSQQCAGDPKFGAVKLNKILFFSDYLAYAQYGSAITNFEYQRLRNGPAPRRFVPIRDEMIEQRELGIQVIPLRNGHTQHRAVNLRKPNLSVFSAEEIALVDTVISALSNEDAQSVSEISHRTVAWQAALEGETIPYGMVFLSNQPLTEAELIRGLEIATELGCATSAA
jgi:hypothetical protein